MIRTEFIAEADFFIKIKLFLLQSVGKAALLK